jgi:purine-binding chemotaxis protein CheW
VTEDATHSSQEADRILRGRARALARPLDRPRDPDEMLEVLEFRLARERYAIEAGFVREVLPLKDLTPLPCTPAFVLGIINVRGQILPVFDLKRLFGLPEDGLTDLHRVIVLEGNDLALGLLADVTVGLQLLDVAGLQSTVPTLTGGVRSDYLKGVTAEQLVVLDAGRILRDPKIIVHDDVDARASASEENLP